MRKVSIAILLLCTFPLLAIPRYDLSYRVSGKTSVFMKDGSLDQWVKEGRPVVLGGSFAVEFNPTGRWHSLQQWNNASIGVGATYFNLGNDKMLGSAVATYGYINFPFYNGRHFRIGVRPSVGIAFCNKRYSNTVPEGYTPYSGDGGFEKSNQSIGSILNA